MGCSTFFTYREASENPLENEPLSEAIVGVNTLLVDDSNFIGEIRHDRLEAIVKCLKDVDIEAG